MRKKAMMGIGTLIVFIAGILAASISAGVILTTQSRLQNKALEVGGKARKGISMNFQTVEVRAIKRNDNYNTIEMIMKLAPGSGDARLNNTLIDIIQDNTSGIYRWQGNSTYYINKNKRTIKETINKTSWTRLHSDLDFDFKEDYIRVYNSTMLFVNLSKEGIVNITIKNISSPQTFNNNYTINGTAKSVLEIKGTTTETDKIDAGMINIYPYEMYLGYGNYVVDYPVMDRNHIDGIVIEGEVFRIFIETRETLNEGGEIMISIKKETGQVQRTMISLPNVMIGDRVKVYP